MKSSDLFKKIKVEKKPWQYHRALIPKPNAMFKRLYTEVADKCMGYKIRMGDKEFEARRISCFVSDQSREVEVYDYNGFHWSEMPVVCEIKAIVELSLGMPFDYCLVHIYRDGSDAIGWHNDKEALNSCIASVSLGAVRKFRFRKIGETKGWDAEYSLGSGDVVLMLNDCQRKYKHTVPQEKKVKDCRINLTFRQYE